MPLPSATPSEPRPTPGLRAVVRAIGAVGALALAVGGWAALEAQAQGQPPQSASAQAAPAAASGGTNAAKTAAPSPKPRPAAAKPLWTDLNAEQQAALRPLAQHWNGLSEAHKRKWLVLSRNYNKLSADEQSTLHGRMADWASLSARDRAEARLNFAEVKRLAPADERKAKWEAYQALSEEERRKLAASAAVPTTAALPLRPVPERKLAPIPDSALQGHGGPRIQLAPPRTEGPLLAPVPPSAEAMYPQPSAAPAAAAAVSTPAATAPAAASDPAPAAQ